MVRNAVGLALLCVLLSPRLMGQDNRFDAAVSAGLAIPKEIDGNGVQHTATENRVGLGTFRVRLNPRIGFAANYGRVYDSQKYLTGGLNVRVLSTVSEFTGVVTFNFMDRGKLHPFALGGAGALVFNPNAVQIEEVFSNISAQRQTRVAYVYGIGFDYNAYWRLDVRLQYRGIFYPGPDYNVPNLYTGGLGHMAEPSAGIAFRF
jgi:hypothetical protein